MKLKKLKKIFAKRGMMVKKSNVLANFVLVNSQLAVVWDDDKKKFKEKLARFLDILNDRSPYIDQ